ncbi:MAG: hypothetical protein KatS3mg058_2358 [Roseiflexus sp.]|nr:MAG: hypothetical protein KatS3mg058_2358 [Roseiflexus sp.]
MEIRVATAADAQALAWLNATLFLSFRALRFAQGKRSAESARVAHDPSRCPG